MIQEQEIATSFDAHRDTRQRPRSRHFLYALLTGLGITLLLTLVLAAIIWYFNPFHLLGNVANRSAALLMLPVDHPLTLLGPGIAFVLFFILALLLAHPLSLVLYLRAVRAVQKHYHTLYTPLTALTNIRRALDTYSQDMAAPAISTQQEQISILDLVQQQETHQMILGVPGAGKTMALRVYQYIASQHPWSLVFHRGSIPVYVPMKNYSLFLKKELQSLPFDAESVRSIPDGTLLDFLCESDLPGMRHLRSELHRLSKQGRLLLLCDGLNEVDSNYLAHVGEELVRLMRTTRNRLVMTCREVDYREQHDFVQLVNDGRASRAVIYPLQPDQVQQFVERYVERQDDQWQHTAGQIMQVIDRSRLRYHCTNPMMLFTLMEIIDKIGVEQGKQIDTRGRLLRESVQQLIAYEQHQVKWNKGAPTEREVVRFLGEIACAARWANDRNAIQLRVSTASSEGERYKGNIAEWTDELQYWLDEHPAQGPFVEDEDVPSSLSYDDLAQLLQFALSASLIEISPGGVLSFRHELIAEYFVAEYFFAATADQQTFSLPIRTELLENVGRWSEPVAIWAGLLANPLSLADRFGLLGRDNPAYVLQALALALVCVGVLWTPPQAEVQRSVILPPSVEESLAIAVRNREAREELARIFTRCAEEGGQEVYRSLLPLIMVEGVDDLLTLLDHTIVPELLFSHLQDAVDNIAYEAQVKRLTRVLGRFGAVAVEQAVELSLPQPERSSRLRAAAINILGGTRDTHAVGPLIARLSDAELFIVERATNALIRLGPELTLSRILQLLEDRTSQPFIVRIHCASLSILGRFMSEPDGKRQLTLMQYQRVLESIVPVLTSNYQTEPETQQLARDILVRQARNTEGAAERDTRWERVLEGLLRYLPSQNEVAVRNVIAAFQEIGPVATPLLIEQLHQQSELVRVRVIEMFRVIRDSRALPHILRLIADPAPAIQQQVTAALLLYAPDSIAGLIDLVLSGATDDVADRAAQILASIGKPVTEAVAATLFNVVPGRTRLLVQVLERVHDPQSVPALITLLQTPYLEPLLTIALMRALSQFPEPRVVPPILHILSDMNPQLYEEAIDALGHLGDIALPALIASLDDQKPSPFTHRVYRAILVMVPFPGEALITALEHASASQTPHILTVFKMQGAEAAQILVDHLLHKDEQIRNEIYQTLQEIPGSLVVPALLEVLNQPAMRRIVTTLLLRYPEAAIAPLVVLLGEHERGDAAAVILPQFGPAILSPLISGLDDQRSMAREHAQRIIVALVRQSPDPQDVLHAIVHLFYPTPPGRAREVLLVVLTHELADVSMPALLEGLEDAYLIEDVSEAFARLSRKGSHQKEILDALIAALHVEERRRGAENALICIGTPAVPLVSELITSQDALVAKAAKDILRDMGVPALSFIWTAHSDKSNPARRDAALEIFHSMRTEAIKDELVSLLVSEKPDEIAMAVALLLERIHDESAMRYADRAMIPELIEYIQSHMVENTNARIIALLLLLGERTIIGPLIRTLDDYPQPRKQLIYSFLLLGSETRGALLDVFQDTATADELRIEIAALLGMMGAPDAVAEYAQNMSSYGLSASRTSLLFPDQLAIALRALGGLLAGGYWHARKLQELRDTSHEDDPARELFNVLLGMRYTPQIAQLQSDLQDERDSHKKEILALTARIVTDQKRLQTLEEELEEIRREHGSRDDELDQIRHERDVLRNDLDQMMQERNVDHSDYEQVLDERDALQNDLVQMVRERDMLNIDLQNAIEDNQSLREQLDSLLTQFNHPKKHR